MSEPSRQGTEILRPYVPRLLLRWLTESPDATFREDEGSMVFVDISGFTKMSERLARHGRHRERERDEAREHGTMHLGPP